MEFPTCSSLVRDPLGIMQPAVIPEDLGILFHVTFADADETLPTDVEMEFRQVVAEDFEVELLLVDEEAHDEVELVVAGWIEVVFHHSIEEEVVGQPVTVIFTIEYTVSVTHGLTKVSVGNSVAVEFGMDELKINEVAHVPSSCLRCA